jgi:hypothetical protein
MKSIKYYSNYRVNKVTNKSFFSWKDNSFVFPDLCYCGHTNNEHTLSDNQCSKKEEFCNCLVFLA